MDDLAPSAPTPRPLEAFVACLATGSLAGSLPPLDGWSTGWPTGNLFPTALASTWAAVQIRRSPAAWRLLLLAIVFLAALRSPGSGSSMPGPRKKPQAQLWQLDRSSGASSEGRLGSSPLPLRVPAGCVRAGEGLRVLQGSPRILAGESQSQAAGSKTPSLARLEVRASDILRLTPAPQSPLAPIIRSLTRLRRAGCARLAKIQNPKLAGFLAALVFGEREDLDYGLADLFTRTGTRHLLALSGLHVVLAAALFAWPLGSAAGALVRALALGCALARERRARWTCALLRAALVLSFLPLGGGGTPIARATLAGALAAIAPVLGGQKPAPGRWPAGRRAQPLEPRPAA